MLCPFAFIHWLSSRHAVWSSAALMPLAVLFLAAVIVVILPLRAFSVNGFKTCTHVIALQRLPTQTGNAASRGVRGEGQFFFPQVMANLSFNAPSQGRMSLKRNNLRTESPASRSAISAPPREKMLFLLAFPFKYGIVPLSEARERPLLDILQRKNGEKVGGPAKGCPPPCAGAAEAALRRVQARRASPLAPFILSVPSVPFVQTASNRAPLQGVFHRQTGRFLTPENTPKHAQTRLNTLCEGMLCERTRQKPECPCCL